MKIKILARQLLWLCNITISRVLIYFFPLLSIVTLKYPPLAWIRAGGWLVYIWERRVLWPKIQEVEGQHGSQTMENNEKRQRRECRKEMDWLKLTLITIMADRGKEGSREDGKKMHGKSNEYWFKGPGDMQACYSVLIRSTFPWSLFEILVSNPPFFSKDIYQGQCRELAHWNYNRAIEYEGEKSRIRHYKIF